MMNELKGDNLLRAAQQQLMSDPRKAGLLGALLLILGIMVARTFLAGAPPPRVSHASHPNLRVPEPGDSPDPAAPARADSPVARWLSTPAPAVGRNLFDVNYELFPIDAPKSGQDIAVEGFWDDIAKSLSDQADQQERRKETLQRVQSQAKALQVTSILMGPKPRAVISGELVGEGEVVASFRVLKIESRRIIVEREGIRLEIQLN